MFSALQHAAVVFVAALLTGGAFAPASGNVEHVIPVSSQSAAPAAAVPSAAVVGFDAGNIIDDSVFFAQDIMAAGSIQSFLDGKVPACEAGYTCLKDFSQQTTTRPADAMCTSTYVGQVRETAAQIIANVGQACGINPQVLLVTLQKEQGLVTHTWPSDWRYTIAMGQGCPDTAACDTRYYGFFNQVYGAAWQMKRYANPPGTSQYFTWFAPGNTWNILYHPNTSCGRGAVFVANQATANLYYYTPYQPNAASLAAGFGTGDGCSSYGNRNFYNYFTAWFGSTRSSVGTAIADEYNRLGGPGGLLGQSTGAVTCGLIRGGCYQDFQNGKIHWSYSSGAHATHAGIQGAWAASGWERGELGYPTGDETCGIPDGGCYQDFQFGKIYWSPNSGPHTVHGGILLTWSGLGYERSWLGYPVTEEICGLIHGGCYQDFQFGKMHWSPTSGAHATRGGIQAAWAATGWEPGPLGYPAGEETCGIPNGGCYQDFQYGKVHWSPATGAHPTTGAILATWAASGYERGRFGYPIASPVCATNGTSCTQQFQGGSLP